PIAGEREKGGSGEQGKILKKGGNMNRVKRVVMTVICFLFLGFASFSNAVTVSIPNTEIAPGTTTVEIPINVDNANGVVVFTAVVKYDNTILDYKSCTGGTLIRDLVGDGDWAFIKEVDEINGKITLLAAALDTENPIALSGGGTLVSITFNILGVAGQTSAVYFSKVSGEEPALVNAQMQQIPATWVDGSVHITGYTLTVNVSGSGTVTKNPDKTEYTKGDIVTLTATPSTGQEFIGWSGDLTGTTNPTTITMDGNKTITANFVKQYTLNVNVSPSGSGTVTKNPDKAKYNEGEQVILTAIPNFEYSFQNWSGSLTGSTNPATIVMNCDKTITANFVSSGFTIEPEVLQLNLILECDINTETQLNIAVNKIGNFSNTVNLSSTTDADTGITTGLNPKNGVPPFSSQLNLSISGNTTPDTYILIIKGQSDDITYERDITIVANTFVSIPIIYFDGNEEIEIPINISNASNLVGFQFTITFDPEILDLTNVETPIEPCDLTYDWTIIPNTTITGEIIGAGFNPTLIGLASERGSIIIIKANVIGEIPEEGIPLTIEEMRLRTPEGQSMPVITQNGLLLPGMPGDIDRNGEVDIFDSILCLRMAVKLPVKINNTTYNDPYETLIKRADLKKDGEIDISDVILILRKAIGLVE
ncbi:MAG TPA: cohesin domain-containing protein, partial [Candidatus Ratteibacteria bacterium]|nr:cohesin domain-containing protein [Candidatus Ratteibacteria bacterium]